MCVSLPILAAVFIEVGNQDTEPLGGVSTTGNPQKPGRAHGGVVKATWSRPEDDAEARTASRTNPAQAILNTFS